MARLIDLNPLVLDHARVVLNHLVGHDDIADRERRVESARHAGENDCAAAESVGQHRGDQCGVDLAHPGSREDHVMAVKRACGESRMRYRFGAGVGQHTRRASSSCGMAQISPMVTMHCGAVVAYRPCAAASISPARSPITTQGAIVFPVVMRGMIEPSAIRRFSTP